MTSTIMQRITTILILVSTMSCTNSVDTDQLFTQCKQFLERNFINKTDSAEIQKGLLQKMTLACDKARDECKKSPEGKRCKTFIKKYD